MIILFHFGSKEVKKTYIFPVYKIGNYHFQQLIQKAINGKGLCTNINQNVRKDFIL